MTLVCISPFGNYLPGDEIPGIPDGASFDTGYFAIKPPVIEDLPAAKPITK